MPVLACPDCGHDVSTMAPACPHCGRPMNTPQAAFQPQPAVSGPEETLTAGTPSPKVLVGRVIGLIMIVIAIPSAAYWIAGRPSASDRHGAIVEIGWWITGIIFLI